MMMMLYAFLFVFVILYMLRALLLAGYNNLNLKHDRMKVNPIFKSWLHNMLLLKPISQPKLNARSIDHKVHIRFQKKSTLYYYALWLCLFAILFLAAKIYLNAFE